MLKHIHFLVHGKTSVISLRVPEFWIFQDKGTIRMFSLCPVTHSAASDQSPGQYDLHSEHIHTRTHRHCCGHKHEDRLALQLVSAVLTRRFFPVENYIQPSLLANIITIIRITEVHVLITFASISSGSWITLDPEWTSNWICYFLQTLMLWRPASVCPNISYAASCHACLWRLWPLHSILTPPPNT